MNEAGTEAERRARRGPSDEEVQGAVPRGTGRREFRVGIFVLLGIASFLLVLFIMTDPATFRGRYMIATTVEDAGGLRKGDPVQMRGVNIGRVHSFRMVDEGVLITLEVEGQWDVPADSRTRLVGTGLLGGRIVEVVPGEADALVRGGAILPGESETGVLDLAGDLGGEAREVLDRIEALLSAGTVESVEGSARELHGLLAELSALTRSQADEVRRLVASLNRSAEGLEEAAAAGPQVASAAARADSALANLASSSQALERASASLETLLARMERGEGTLGRLATDASLYENLNRAAASLVELTDDIQRNPRRYINVSIF